MILYITPAMHAELRAWLDMGEELLSRATIVPPSQTAPVKSPNALYPLVTDYNHPGIEKNAADVRPRPVMQSHRTGRTTRLSERLTMPRPGTIKDKCYQAFEKIGYNTTSPTDLAKKAHAMLNGEIKFTTARAYASDWFHYYSKRKDVP